MKKLLIAIPCLNEAETIADVISAIPATIQGIDEITTLVVDDGSTDNTSFVASSAGATVIKHNGNRGVGLAFQTAVEFSVNHSYDYMVNIDGDRQFDPKDIPTLLQPILAGHADMATASRFKNAKRIQNMSRLKLIGNHMMSFLISSLCGRKFFDVSCGFRAYTREALLRLNLHGKFTYTQETFLDLISKQLCIEEVPITVRYFKDRKSRVAGNIFKYALNTSSIILRIYRDYFPMRFFMGIAAINMVPAIIFGCIFWSYYLNTGRFYGALYAGLTAGFFLILVLMFIILAVVTDMLDRIRVNQDRILYMFKKKLGDDFTC